jgi:hypothetical protein
MNSFTGRRPAAVRSLRQRRFLSALMPLRAREVPDALRPSASASPRRAARAR